MNLSTHIGGLALENPVIAASGTFGYGEEYIKAGDVSWFGAVSIKGTTIAPRAGNPPPRTCETPSGLLNSIGLENPGARVVIGQKLPWLARFSVPIIANISAVSCEEFSELAGMFAKSPHVSALEVNVSCPNVKAGGIAFGTSADMCYEATRAVRKAWKGPLIVKLTPNVADMRAIAKAAVEGGADALSLINTLVGMAIDIHSMRPVLGNITGGLSGPAIKPVALRCVWEVSQAVSVPVIGMGGICSATDALEFIMAGASAVAIGTGLLIDPELPRKVTQGIKEYCESRGIESLQEIVGAAWR
ncbi:MAG: dihydroorotate dehydrogenase [Bacillota bacterium]|jgi:dihydroorotate dehydrogenase (NAD+) catalytic subunit|nr:dihydroorotate dehydrogenase [Candidatus Fermentithermobacillaceae bacterium]